MLEKIKKIFNIKTQKSVNEKIDNLFDELSEDVILVRLGEDLAAFYELFCCIVQELREEIKSECGFILPEICIQEGAWLQENEYIVFIQGTKILNEFLIPNEEGIRNEFYENFKTVIYENLKNIFTNELAERYIDTAQRKNGRLIWNVVQILSVPEIKIILSDIIGNGKSINNIGFIFEKIGEEVLLNNGYRTNKESQNPHAIAKNVSKVL